MGMAEKEGVGAIQLYKSGKNDNSTRIASGNEAGFKQITKLILQDDPDSAVPAAEMDPKAKHADEISKSQMPISKSQKSSKRPASAKHAIVKQSRSSNEGSAGQSETNVRGSVDDEHQMWLDEDFLFSEEEDRCGVMFCVSYCSVS
jgi:hypothetical protein